MSFMFKDRIGLSIFGSSHGEMVGATLDGIPAGFQINRPEIALWMDRRAPGRSAITTQRKEDDTVEFLSGLQDEVTDGGSITFVIKNKDSIKKHYDEIMNNPRPGHGDLSLFFKYGPYRNYSGGGFLSGRMTAPLVAAGALAMQMLAPTGIKITSYIDSMGPIHMKKQSFYEQADVYQYQSRMPDPESDAKAIELIRELQSAGDSTGATIRTVARDIPEGLGEPFFDSVESIISHLAFSIPGVKGIEFGSGFSLATMRGSEASDPFGVTDGRVHTHNNRNGGVLGGMTYGDPIEFRAVMKPTSSIRGDQETINLETMKYSHVSVLGRHDPCIAIRAVPVFSCVTSLAILDLYLRRQSGYKGNFEKNASYGKDKGN
jgi:chorismate synthase